MSSINHNGTGDINQLLRRDSGHRPGILTRAWERIQYPAGRETRERLLRHRSGGGYGW